MKNDEGREKTKNQTNTEFHFKNHLSNIYYLFKTNVQRGLLLINTKKKGKKKKKLPLHQLKIGYGGYVCPFPPIFSLGSQMSAEILSKWQKTKKFQRRLGLPRKEYQKNVPTEIKPQTINSKSTTKTSEKSKDVGNLLRTLN